MALTSEKVSTNCRGCGHGGCGIILSIEDGKIVGVEGDKAHPISKGYICLKAYAAVEQLNHPDRLRHPLRRVGPKASGNWEKISWSEALNTIAKRLKEIADESGPESVVFMHGTGRDYFHFMNRFTNLFGSPNYVTNGHMCYIPRLALTKILGLSSLPVVDYDSSPRCVLVWGSNPVISNPDEYVGINLTLNLKKGAKMIVVDPRRTKLASAADLWLQIRPSTDLALALGMIRHIMNRELYDKEFVENYATGFDELKKFVARYTPQLVEEITRVPQENMKEAAEIYATTKPAAIHWGVGVEQNINCIGTDTALMYLVALTGNLDTPGGNVLFDQPPIVGYREFGLPDKLPEEKREKRIGGQEYKLLDSVGRCPPYAVWDAIIEGRPYKVRALYIAGSNPLVVRENTSRVREALEKVEFMVVADLFRTPTAEYADIILPVASWLEYNTIGDYWKSHGYVFARRKVVDNPDCWSDLKIFNELGKRFYPEYFWDDPDQALDYILKPAGVTWEEFVNIGYLRGKVEYRKYVKRGFDTKSRRFEFYPEKFKELGLGPLPEYQENPETPVSAPHLAELYPYMLITGGRSIEYFNSEGRQIKILRRIHPEPLVEINPKTAEKHGIKEGDWVIVENHRGSVKMKARLTEGIDPQVIHAEHGWWFPEIETPDHGYQISNINLLTDDRPPVDPLMGSTRLKSLLCNIRKA